MPQVYPHPPIQEAICEFHLLGDEWNLTTLGDVVRAFAAEYPAPPVTQQQIFGTPTPRSDSIQVMSAQRIALRNDTGDQILTVAQGVLGVHVVGSYPGWEAFKTLALTRLTKHRELRRFEGLSRVAVRAVNRVTLPKDSTDLTAWFVHAPRALSERIGPPRLFSRHETFAFPDGAWLVVNFATPGDEPEQRVVILDLNAIMVKSPENAIAWEEAAIRLEELHEYVSEAFEASITDLLRGRFCRHEP